MTVGAQITQPEPATIVTIAVRTKVHGGCPPHGVVGSSGPWGRAVLEVVVWDTPYLVHTGHNEACGSSLRTAWVRWSRIAWVGGARAQLTRPEPSPRAWARKGARRQKARGVRAGRAERKHDVTPWCCPLPQVLRWSILPGFGGNGIIRRVAVHDPVFGLAQELGVHRNWLYTRIRNGTLPATRHAVIGHYLIPDAPELLTTLRAQRDRCCYR